MSNPLTTTALNSDQRVLNFDALAEHERILTEEMLPGLTEEPRRTRVWLGKMMDYLETLQRDKVRCIEGKDYSCSLVGHLYFEQNQFVLLPTHSAQIDQWQRQQDEFEIVLTFKSGKTLLIEGHASVEGSRDYNLGLAEKRVASIVSYLIENKQFPEKCMHKLAFGEDEPLDKDRLEPNELDRRVSIYMIAPYQAPPPQLPFPTVDKPKESFYFKLQQIGGFSFSATLGIENMTYIIYDPKNRRMGDFVYAGANLGIGVGAAAKGLKNEASKVAANAIDEIIDLLDKTNNTRKAAMGTSPLDPEEWIAFSTNSPWTIEMFEGPARHLDAKMALWLGVGVEHLLLNLGQGEDQVDIQFNPYLSGELNLEVAYGIGALMLRGIAEDVDEQTPNPVFKDEFGRRYSPF